MSNKNVIVGYLIVSNKTILLNLLKIPGLGLFKINKICKYSGLDQNLNWNTLSNSQYKLLAKLLHRSSEFWVFGDFYLRKQKSSKDLLKQLRCYRGLRLIKGLPSRGQNTRSNAKTARKRL